jgi:hypothetical protein
MLVRLQTAVDEEAESPALDELLRLETKP